MGKRRRLRKSGGGELEVNMQDVASDYGIDINKWKDQKPIQWTKFRV